MAVDFPANPNAGDEFVANGITYRFEGGAWVIGFQPSALQSVPQEFLYNSAFPNVQNIDVDISGCRSVDIKWNGAVNEGTPAVFGMTVRAGNTWYESADTYRLAGNTLSASTFTGNLSGLNFPILYLSGTPIAGDWSPSGSAVLLNGNAQATFRVNALSQHISAPGMDQRDIWLTANTAIAALQKVPLTGLRFRFLGTQKFVAGGWLQVIGNKG